MTIFSNKVVADLEKNLGHLNQIVEKWIDLKDRGNRVPIRASLIIKNIQQAAKTLKEDVHRWRCTCPKCGRYSDREPYCNCP